MIATALTLGAIASAVKDASGTPATDSDNFGGKRCFVKRHIGATKDTAVDWFSKLGAADVNEFLPEEDRLGRLIIAGLRKHKLLDDPEYRKRVTEELAILRHTGFDDLLMVAYDMANDRKRKMSTSNMKGTIETSLIAYLLDLVDEDPIKTQRPFGFREGSGNE